MNQAIWRKAVSDAWRQLAVSCVLLVLFAWVFVWFTSTLETGLIESLVKYMPGFFKRVMRLEAAQLVTGTGKISFVYLHVITLLVCLGWAVGRGSDPITGEIGRGTMDLILSLPVWRVTVLIVPTIVATLGAALLAGSILIGIWLGLLSVELPEGIELGHFFPGSLNLFCMMFCMTGITAFVSSWNQNRGRTIGLTVGFYVVSVIIKMIWRLWPEGDWLAYFTFLGAFRPQTLIVQPETYGVWALSMNLPLIAIGLVCCVAAGIIFSYRDIPAPK